MTGSLPLRLETNEGVARAILDMQLYDLGLDFLQRYAGMIEVVTAEDIMRVSQEYLRVDEYALAIAGPPEQAADVEASPRQTAGLAVGGP
jgi:zinc protease